MVTRRSLLPATVIIVAAVALQLAPMRTSATGLVADANATSASAANGTMAPAPLSTVPAQKPEVGDGTNNATIGREEHLAQLQKVRQAVFARFRKQA